MSCLGIGVGESSRFSREAQIDRMIREGVFSSATIAGIPEGSIAALREMAHQAIPACLEACKVVETAVASFMGISKDEDLKENLALWLIDSQEKVREVKRSEKDIAKPAKDVIEALEIAAEATERAGQAAEESTGVAVEAIQAIRKIPLIPEHALILDTAKERTFAVARIAGQTLKVSACLQAEMIQRYVEDSLRMV